MNHKDVDTHTFKNLFEQDSFVLIDVRTPEEFNNERLAGAMNIGNFEVELFC